MNSAWAWIYLSGVTLGALVMSWASEDTFKEYNTPNPVRAIVHGMIAVAVVLWPVCLAIFVVVKLSMKKK